MASWRGMMWLSNILHGLRAHNKCDVFALQKDPPNLFPLLCLGVDLFSIIKNQVHVFIKADDVAFNPQDVILIQPNLDPCPVL